MTEMTPRNTKFKEQSSSGWSDSSEKISPLSLQMSTPSIVNWLWDNRNPRKQVFHLSKRYKENHTSSSLSKVWWASSRIISLTVKSKLLIELLFLEWISAAPCPDVTVARALSSSDGTGHRSGLNIRGKSKAAKCVYNYHVTDRIFLEMASRSYVSSCTDLEWSHFWQENELQI